MRRRQQRRRERRDERRGDELAWPYLRRVTPEDFHLRVSVAEVLAAEASKAAPDGVGGADLGREQDTTGVVEQAVVELVVLALLNVFSEAADAVEDVATVSTEGDGIDEAGAARAEGSAADAETRRHRGGDGATDVRIAFALDDAADAVDTAIQKRVYAAAYEVDSDCRVAVDANDDVAARGCKTDVQAGGRAAGRVAQEPEVDR